MPTADQWIELKGAEYLRQIAAARPVFLSELPVPPEDLKELFLRLRQSADPGRNDRLRACLAVAAVQAAVRAEGDETSYLDLFFKRLNCPSSITLWNDRYGPAILAFLKEHFDEVDRPGPFRYVRPILNQAGISNRTLPSFARFLSQLRAKCGFGYVPDEEYTNALRSVGSCFACHFLQEAPGRRYTRDAMRTWERIDRERPSEQELAKIPGYRRRFWPELLSHVGPGSTATSQRSRRFPPPAQYLDSERARSVIRFDAKAVEALCYRMFGRPVLFAFEVIHDDRKWEGEIRQPGGQRELWRVDTWLPSGENWAVFRLSDGRIVAKSGCDNEALTPGLYYFVGPETDAAIDHSEVPGEIEEEGPYFDIGGQDIECAYRIWTVRLAPRFEWANGAITVSDGMAPNLTFVRQGNPLAGRTHVFTRHLAPVRIDGWSKETAAYYNIVLERGSERTTLNPITPDGLLEIIVPCPARGRVFLEPKGRLASLS